MAKKKTDNQAEVISEQEGVVIVKANAPLDKKQFELLSELMRKEEGKSGMKVVVLPYSVDLVEVNVPEQDADKSTDEDEKGKEKE
ncbi:hypothetical protein [Sporosarcina sp. OR05]|uniref:hypothetical protein n=1 Tax=Sporosarcina sp. OR05 TaxID=2969819 RepID=UPI00352AE277